MGLGDNIAFFNETTFGLGDEQSTTTGAKVVFNKLDNISTISSTHSATIEDVVYAFEVAGNYHGEIISIVNEKRLSTQVTVNTGTNFQAATATGFNSVGPTLRRLNQLGYV